MQAREEKNDGQGRKPAPDYGCEAVAARARQPETRQMCTADREADFMPVPVAELEYAADYGIHAVAVL